MNTNSYTNVPELLEFFDLIEDNGKIISHRNSDYNQTVNDLNQMALLVSKKWALQQPYDFKDTEQLLEVLHGTVQELECLKDRIISQIIRKGE